MPTKLRRNALALLLALAAWPVTDASSATPRRFPAGFFVIAFEQRIDDTSRARLARTGVEILDYVPKNSYLVWATSGEIRAAERLGAIRSARPVRAEEKIHPELISSATMPFVDVSVYGPRARSAVEELRRLGRVATSYPARADGLTATVAMWLPASSIAAAASLPEVIALHPASPVLIPEDEAADQILAGNIRDDRPQVGYETWLRKRKLDGKGVVVAIVDTGIQELHPALSGRVVKTYSYGRDPGDTFGHGTHVAGIVGGAPSGATERRDPEGFSYGLGVAPQVRFVDQNALSTDNLDFPPDVEGFEVYTSDAWDAGARLWNASWNTGEGARVGYTASTRMMDVLSRNAVFDKKGREEFLMVFSAGNAGERGPTTPHEAKNIIAVGATFSGRGWVCVAVMCQEAPVGSSDIDEVVDFSSRGPARDGRIFPTISAPGAAVVSTRAPEGAVCNVPPPDSLALYAYCSGTSMAAPHGAGASALVHQWWKREAGEWPSPALVCALLVNSATDIAANDIPNNDEGWGRINLGELFAPARSIFVDQYFTFSKPRQTKSYVFKVDKGSNLRVTLAWSDAPGSVFENSAVKVSPPALVNDLDLEVQLLGRSGKVVETWRGNVFEKGTSASGGKFDRLNNLENVFLEKPPPGRYRIVVRAFNVPGDGIPENADKTDQDFALAIRSR